MIEDRKRSIIHSDSGPEPEQGAYPGDWEEAEDGSRESLLQKRVYLPLPAILLGFLAIILVSVSLTYVVVMWPAEKPVFPDNPEMARFEAAAAPANLPKKVYRPVTALTPEAPPGSLDLPPLDTSRRFAGLNENRANDTLTRDFSPETASPAGMPVADFPAAGKKNALPAARTTALALEAPGKTGRPRAAGIKPPVLELALQPRKPALGGVQENTVSLEAPGERNFARAAGINNPVSQFGPKTREADAVTFGSRVEPLKNGGWPEATPVGGPEISNSENPLLETAAGGDLKARDFKPGEAAGTDWPVAEMALAARPAQNIEGLKAVALEPKRFSGQNASSPGELIAEVDPAGRPLEFQPSLDEANAALFEHSFAAALGLEDPVAELDLPHHGAAYPGQFRVSNDLEIRSTTLAAAIGLDRPVALLSLPARSATGNFSSLDIPGQKQPPRRYARAVIPPERLTPVPSLPEREIIPEDGGDVPAWRRYAARPPEDIEGKGKIVIIIDDMGNNPAMARKLSQLDGPLNFAFLPYAPNLEGQTGAMRQAGHELLVHLPMEPSGDEYPGPHALLTSLTEQQLLETIDWNLSRFEGFVGVNNHMGSRFTKDEARMRLVMEELHRRGLLFLDSLTVAHSEGIRWARRLGMPWAGRDVFLDNVVDEAAILAQLKKVEVIAKRRGLAIAIGHPHGATLAALQKWLPTLAANGLVLVPLSSVVEGEELSKLASFNPGK